MYNRLKFLPDDGWYNWIIRMIDDGRVYREESDPRDSGQVLMSRRPAWSKHRPGTGTITNTPDWPFPTTYRIEVLAGSFIVH